jgi:N-ethylmaleimide reductase
MSRLPRLLSPVTLGALTLPNRVLMAPMLRGRARTDGCVTEEMLTHFVQRAGAGLVITEAAMVSPQAVGYPRSAGLWTEEQGECWSAVVRAVHAAGGRIALQLMHVGRISLEALQPGGGAPVSSSAVRASDVTLTAPDFTPAPAAEPRALDVNEIREVVAQFGQAARRAKVAGFDAVEIQGAHGYLIDQFLRDGVNQRHDRYGGSAENRARFLFDVVEAVGKEVGADRTGVRLSPIGTFNDMRDRDPLTTFGTALRHLASFDLAWTHLAGMQDADLTRRLRDAYGAPLVLNGGFTADAADEAIRTDLAAAVSFGKAFIANPDLVDRFTTGSPLATPDRETLYGGDGRGYTDYPAYDAVALEREAEAAHARR